MLDIPSYRLSRLREYVHSSSRADTASKAEAKPTNNKDKNAVAVYLEDVVAGHVPHNIAPRFSQFLLRDVNRPLRR